MTNIAQKVLQASDFGLVGEGTFHPITRPVTPPKVWRKGSSKRLRQEVESWYRSLFMELLQNRDLGAFHRRCTVYQQFFMGVSAPSLENYAKRRINLCAVGIDTTFNHLSANPLELRYHTNKPNAYHDFAESMTRLFKWHDLKTDFKRARAWLEMSVPIFGLAALMFKPDVEFKYDSDPNPFNEMEVVPGKWQAVDPRSMFFKPEGNGVWDPEVLVIRTIESGREMDQRYPEVLKREGLTHFPRGPQMYDAYSGGGSSYGYGGTTAPDATRGIFRFNGRNDVEKMQFWVKNFETEKVKVWFPIINPETGEILSHDTPEAMVERTAAAQEFQEISARGIPANVGENHHNHHLVHVEQFNGALANGLLGPLEIENHRAHIKMHEQMKKDQGPDEVAIVPKHKGGIRYGFTIGGLLHTDGSSGLVGKPRPVAYFPNGINPESFIPRSNLDNILPLQRDVNELIHNWMVYVRKSSFPTMMGPQYMADEKKYPRGPDSFWPIKPETPAHHIPKTFTMPPFPSDAKELIQFLIGSVETFSGSTSVSRGEPSAQRSSGRETAILQMQSDKQFTSQQSWLTEGHVAAAKIRLAQIKQFGDERIWVPSMGLYASESHILASDIDLNAIVEIIRVPANRDVLSENDEKVLRWTMLFRDLGLPIDWLIELMTKQSDTAMASRMSGFMLGKIQQMQQQQAAGGGPGTGGPVLPDGVPQDGANDEGLIGALAGGGLAG